MRYGVLVFTALSVCGCSENNKAPTPNPAAPVGKENEGTSVPDRGKPRAKGDTVEEAPKKGRTRSVGHAKARTIPIDELVTSAARIILGTVKEVKRHEVTLAADGKHANAEVLDLTIAVTKSLKGSDRPGDNVQLRMLSELATEPSVKDEILLYLATESRLGLTQPIGIYSGHFKIKSVVADDGTTIKSAINLIGNDGLWSEEKSLFQSSTGLSKSTFSQKLSAVAASDAVKSRVLDIANSGSKPGPVPLLLLEAATAAKLESQ